MKANPSKEEVQELLTLIDEAHFEAKISTRAWKLVHDHFNVLVR